MGGDVVKREKSGLCGNVRVCFVQRMEDGERGAKETA